MGNKFINSRFGKSLGLTPDSSVKTEIIAGLTTFFAMCYIIFVNPMTMLGPVFGDKNNLLFHSGLFNAIYIGTIIAAVIGTLLYAFLAKKPFAQASGMGLNAFFWISFIIPAQIAMSTSDAEKNYGAGLVIILISGLIFLILSITGLRAYIAKALPDCLKKAIPAGIGLFIAFIGMQNSKLIVANPGTIVGLGDFTSWATAGPLLATFLGFLAIVIFAKSNVGFLKKGAIILGILVSTVLFYLFTWSNPFAAFNGFGANIGQSFKDFGKYGFSLFKGESWSIIFGTNTFGTVFNIIMLVVTFCLVDMFDTVGTLYGTCAQAGMLDENGDPIDIDKCMLCDSIATVTGSFFGVSTVTTFVESASGVAEGGRTGLTSLVVAGLFAICLVLSPLASIIPGNATAPALIYVGVLMLKNFKAVDMDDLSSAAPAFLALIMMPLTYSISNGIAIGAISYVIIRVATLKYNKDDIVVTVIAVLFALKYAFIR